MDRSEIEKFLDQIDPSSFEDLIGDLWEELDYETTVKPESRDKGIDVVARRDTPFDEKVLIQAKANSEENKIDSGQVRKYRTLYQQEDDVDRVVIVTTSTATSPAKELANDLDVDIINRQKLIDLILDADLDLKPQLASSEEKVPSEQVKRLVESAEKGVWNPDNNSTSSSGGRSWSERSIDTNEPCSHCHDGQIGWDSNTRIGKCSSCNHEYKFRNGRWVPIELAGEEWQAAGSPESEIEVANESEDNVLDVLAGLAIISLLLSSIHSFISWSFHSYQIWLVLLYIISISANELLIKAQNIIGERI
ncbi:restriction endonuclease [Haloglomus litoreum]|uniref:restriction endonuclease n=1 Tax=Haloglomus litoreum TaxID=3034026 RepID=UPI0023E8DF27|nr:restriction endonuclease [Haloglomus sp. DT116]